MKTYRVVLAATLVLLFSVTVGEGFCQEDEGNPDSMFVLEPSYTPDGCTGGMTTIVPIHLATDGCPYLIEFRFEWQGDAACEYITILSPWLKDSTLVSVDIDSSSKTCIVLVYDPWHFFTAGSARFAEIAFSSPLEEIIEIDFIEESTILGNLHFYWIPVYQNLDVTVTVPGTITLPPGDADASSSVDIDDVVYLINYIFAGGCPPWDLNSGDVDASCGIDIDDVVFLIEFIFGGGPAPLPGCVR